MFGVLLREEEKSFLVIMEKSSEECKKEGKVRYL